MIELWGRECPANMIALMMSTHLQGGRHGSSWNFLSRSIKRGEVEICWAATAGPIYAELRSIVYAIEVALSDEM